MKYLLLIAPCLLLVSCNVKEKLGLTEKTRTPIQNSNPSNCPKWASGETITIDESITLPAGCKYDRVSFKISRSNINFDCNKTTFNGLGKTKRNTFYLAYKKDEAPRSYAFSINGSEDNYLENITIKNCHLNFYTSGIKLNFGLKKTTHDDLKNNRNVQALENYLRTISPKNIIVENTSISSSHAVGIYVQRYITEFQLKNSTINDGDIGVYLESGTQKNIISHSTFTKNGETTYDANTRKRKLRIRKREAIAIDSSAYNTITDNTFKNNAGGAIFLYKNCYENYKDSNSLPRFQHSDFNTIQNNTFIGEPRGVWVASRQSRDLENFNCGDPLIHSAKGNKKYYEDFAKNNEIIDNIFEDVENGVILEDDDNTVSGNTFKGSVKDNDIIIGTKIRSEVLNRPAVRNIIKDNIFNSNASPHVFMRHNSDNTNNTFSNNQPTVSTTDK